MLSRILCAALFALPAFSSALLYDDLRGTTPGSQGWLIYGNNAFLSGGSATEPLAAGGTQLLTDNAVSAGYANRVPVLNTLVNAGFPSLNRANGYLLNFELQVNSESHLNNDRSGFSVIVVSQDLLGIETRILDQRNLGAIGSWVHACRRCGF